jgi:hypothetical protein
MVACCSSHNVGLPARGHPHLHLLPESSLLEEGPCSESGEAKFSSSTHANSKCTMARRGVRFQVDEYDRVLAEVITYEKPPSECYSALYWSKDDKNEFLNHARLHAKDYGACYPERLERLEIAFSSCADGNLSDHHKNEDMRSILQWVKSNARGLEDAVSSIFYQERRNVVQQILEYHEYLLDTFEPGEAIDEALCRYSELKTRRASAFAFTLAMCDFITL